MRVNARLHTSLLSLFIALSFTPLNSRADFTQGDYYYTVTNNQAAITGFNNNYSGSLSITNSLGGYPVTSIGGYAFYYCFRLTSVLFCGTPPTLGGSSVFSSDPATLYYLPAFASNWPASFAGRPTLCWNPAVQQDASFGFTPDRFGFSIVGTTNIPIGVQASTNLASGVWTSLTNTNLGTSGSFRFTDHSSTNQPSCFYRIVWP